MVNARISDQRKVRIHRLGASVFGLVSAGVLLWLSIIGIHMLRDVLFTHNNLYNVRHLDLRSDGKLQSHHIKEYADLEEGRNLFQVDIHRVQKELESVPLVDTVSVSRSLPDTLMVRITERVAIARLGENNKRHYLAVDREGYVLGPSSRSINQPVLVGFEERGLRPGSYLKEPQVKQALSILDICDTTRLGEVIRIKRINVRGKDYLDMILTKNERIVIGNSELEWRLKKLAEIIQKATAMGKTILSVDLTVDKNFPVKLR